MRFSFDSLNWLEKKILRCVGGYHLNPMDLNLTINSKEQLEKEIIIYV